MGDCTSRIDKKEIEQHIRDFNNKNDRYFNSIPFSHSHSYFLIEETSTSILESRRRLYAKKKKELLRKYDETSDSVPSIKETIIEVQKGVYLAREGLCFLQGKPYVVVSLEPNGPSYETFAADLLKPVWYRVFQNKSLIQYSFIKFTVKLTENSEVVGSVSVPFTELLDQKVHEKWYDLQETGGNAPCLKLRLQYVECEKKLYQDLADLCTEYISQLSFALANLKKNNELL